RRSLRKVLSASMKGDSTPITGRFVGCCAPAASGHDAAPPRKRRKLHRFMFVISFGRCSRSGSGTLLIGAETLVHRSAGRSLDIRLKLFADVCARYSDVHLVY